MLSPEEIKSLTPFEAVEFIDAFCQFIIFMEEGINLEKVEPYGNFNLQNTKAFFDKVAMFFLNPVLREIQLELIFEEFNKIFEDFKTAFEKSGGDSSVFS